MSIHMLQKFKTTCSQIRFIKRQASIINRLFQLKVKMFPLVLHQIRGKKKERNKGILKIES